MAPTYPHHHNVLLISMQNSKLVIWIFLCTKKWAGIIRYFLYIYRAVVVINGSKIENIGFKDSTLRTIFSMKR